MSSKDLNPTEFASATNAITAAFGDPTRRQIYLYLHERPDGSTANTVATHFGLHPNVARHHLEKLVAGGYLYTDSTPATGKVGRPSKRYIVLQHDFVFESALRKDEILASLLNKALRHLPAELVAELAEEVGLEHGHRIVAAMGDASVHQRSFRSALYAVAEAMSAHGFDAHTEEHATGLKIVADHCPFGDTAVANPVICAVDQGMIKGMLEALYGSTTTQVEMSQALGAARCVTSVES